MLKKVIPEANAEIIVREDYHAKNKEQNKRNTTREESNTKNKPKRKN